MGKVFILICFLISTATVTANADDNWLNYWKENNKKFTNEMCAEIYKNGWKAYNLYEEQKGYVAYNKQRLWGKDCDKKKTKRCKELKGFYENNKTHMEKAEKDMLNYSTVYNSFCK